MSEDALLDPWANKRSPMKKEATPKRMRLRKKYLRRKIGNLKTQGAKKKTSDEKRGNIKMQWVKKKDLR
jgi:hypothetical protein